MFISRKMKLFWVMLTSKAKALDSKISVILESKASALVLFPLIRRMSC